MRKLWVLGLLTLMSLPAAARAELSAPSRIKAVTLFSDQALVKREALVKVPQGLNEILIEVQAFQVDPESVSAKVYGEGEVYSVQFREKALKQAPQANIQRLEQQLRELAQSKQQLTDQKKTLGKREAFLDAFIDFSKVQVPQDLKTRLPSIEELNQALAFLNENYQKVHAQRQTLNRSLDDVEREIKLVQQELAKLKGRRHESSKLIEVLFAAAKEQQVRLEIDYLVRKAAWQPLYRVAVPDKMDRADLTMFAKIAQKTGEDWEQVALAVSNVIPLRGLRLPELSSWWLDVPRVALRTQSKLAVRTPQAPMLAEELADRPADDMAQKEPAAFVAAQRKASPLSFEYLMPRPLNIESRDKETILPLFAKPLQGNFYHLAVPQQSGLSYLVCEARADKELLSGPLNVYLGGQFVGSTLLEEKKAGERFNLSLGADREVKVKRVKTTDKIKETYFGKFDRDTVVRQLAFKITVENIKDRPVVLKVMDRIPVARTDRIRVEDLKLSPEPDQRNIDDRQGVMRWHVELPAGAKREIDISFVVHYPKQMPLEGF